MKALLLAAGFGTRLKPYTDHTPKVLMPICGKPLLDYWLHDLTAAGISDILVNTHYLYEKVYNFLDQSDYEVKVFHEEVLLGTGGTLLANKDFFANDSIMLVHADNLSHFDVDAFMSAHENRPSDCHITMMSFATDTPESCGILELDENNIVVEFHEKVANPPGNRANAAVYILDESVMGFLRSLGKEEIDFSTEVIPHYMGRILEWHNDVYHRDIGTPESYEKANKEFGELLNG
ncbi:nucleotidyltransferase family protein [Lentisphaera marina]|uniref:nucleotidyltransferase family protein n=1 Tax=Lentisphaera marina TaxID=1111041 RepID=UPI002365D124|nr:nucleotidyltransferase family protein [Lentisphaera marina]MDD7985722.1 nucleotidyltransferase family protein [Lentisphaera marina]